MGATEKTADTLVTGATGFVGGNLVERLLAEGHRVRALVLPDDPGCRRLSAALGYPPDLEWAVGDITDAASLDGAFEGIRYVFHCAAMVTGSASQSTFRNVNVTGTANVCRSSLFHSVVRLVVVSTADVFGLPKRDEVFTEQSPYRPWGEPYPDTKIAAAEFVRDCRQRRGLSATLVYPGWVYGPGDPAFFPTVIDMVRSGIAPVWGDGSRFAIDFVHVSDLCDAMIAAIGEDAAAGEDYLVLDDKADLTVGDVYRVAAEELGVKLRVPWLPQWLVYSVAVATHTLWRMGIVGEPAVRTNDVKSFGYNFRFSAEKAHRLLGWSPQHPTRSCVREALRAVIQQGRPQP